jgi:Capsule polysaccharide biosynthesis protein
MPAQIILHLNLDGLSNWQNAARFEFYRRLHDIALTRAVEVSVVRLTQPVEKIAPYRSDTVLHFAHGASVSGTGWLNSCLAYLPGFWHINPTGVLANSPAKDLAFEASDVRFGPANRFLTDLQNRFSKRRSSRYWQKSELCVIPKDCIAVFLQGRYPYSQKQNFLSMEQMIREILIAGTGRAVVVKPHPHPLGRDLALGVLSKLQGEGHRFIVTDANVHDILEAAAVVVSVNSSVTFEGFMHGKPAIVFGRTDHSSLVETVTREGQFSDALDAALKRDWQFAKMLYWYFKMNTIEVRSRKFEGRLHQEIQRSGIDPEYFGIRPVAS